MTLYVISREFTQPKNIPTTSWLDRFLGRNASKIQHFDLSALLDQYQFPDADVIISGIDPGLEPAGIAVQDARDAFLYFRRKDATGKGALYTGRPDLLRSVDIRRVRTDERGTTVRFDDAWELGRGVVHYPNEVSRSAGAEAFLAVHQEDRVGYCRHAERLRQIL